MTCVTCAAEAIGNCLVHSNHGVMICAESRWLAFDLLYYLERVCQVLVKARSMNMPLKGLPDEVCRSLAYNLCLRKNLQELLQVLLKLTRIFAKHQNVIQVDSYA